MVVYKITNLINNKIYIGSDKNNNPEYLGSGKLIKQAIKKYGKENFKKEILCECLTLNELIEKEKYWIVKLNSNIRNIGYNISNGYFGGDTFTNHPNKEEKRLLISKNVTGKKNPMAGTTPYKVWLKKFGKAKADELEIQRRQKLSQTNKGRKGYNNYNLWIEKYGIKKANKKFKLLKNKRSKNSAGANNSKAKIIFIYNNKNNIEKIFKQAKEAASYYGYLPVYFTHKIDKIIKDKNSKLFNKKVIIKSKKELTSDELQLCEIVRLN